MDKLLGQPKWADAIALELQQINNYGTFKDLGRKDKVGILDGCKIEYVAVCVSWRFD